MKKSCSISVSPSQFAGRILEVLSALPPRLHCQNCGSEVTHLNATLSYKGKVSKIQLPICPKCSPEDEQVNTPAHCYGDVSPGLTLTHLSRTHSKRLATLVAQPVTIRLPLVSKI